MRPRILFLAQPSPRLQSVLRALQSKGVNVVLAFTPHQGVAIFMHNQVAGVVLDATLIRNDGWSVAKSLKLIKPKIKILLMDSRERARGNGLPTYVDGCASIDDPDAVIRALSDLLGNTPQQGILTPETS